MPCRWRIRHKLMLGMGLVGAIMALLLAGTLKGLASYRATMRMIDSKLFELNEADKLRAALNHLDDPYTSQQTQALELHRKTQLARKAMDDYKQRLQTTVVLRRDPDQGVQEIEQVRALETRFERLENGLRDAVKEGRVVRSGPIDLLAEGSRVKVAIDELVRTSSDLSNIIYMDLNARIQKSRRDYKISLAIVLSTSVAAILLMASLLRFFYRWVFHPIRDLEQGVGRVARGNFDHRIEVRSGDEIEDLAKAFNDMTGRLREMYRDLAQQVNERSRQLVRSERLAGVGFLAAGVAHEINNPLAGIAFCSEALKRRLGDLLPARPREEGSLANATFQNQEREIFVRYLDMIEEEAFRCKDITQRLLAFSRGSDRRREPVVVVDLIQSVLDMMQHHEKARGKEIVFETSERIEAWVNDQEIKQVLLNLVVNSLDSMDDGGKLVITQTTRNDMIELTFRDTGCGMTEEVLENIFEPFFTRSRTGKGTGLGLSISHQIIIQHGGDIEAASAGQNQGSTFTVRLPLGPPAEQPAEDAPDPETEFVKLSAARKGRRAA